VTARSLLKTAEGPGSSRPIPAHDIPGPIVLVGGRHRSNEHAGAQFRPGSVPGGYDTVKVVTGRSPHGADEIALESATLESSGLSVDDRTNLVPVGQVRDAQRGLLSTPRWLRPCPEALCVKERAGAHLAGQRSAGDDQKGLHPPEQVAPLEQPFTETAVVRVPDLDGHITQPVGEDLMQGDDLVVSEFDVHGQLHGSLRSFILVMRQSSS
jgi:hypothetical protein